MEPVPRPSGKRLPLLLLKKWKQSSNEEPSMSTTEIKPTRQDGSFTVEEIEERLWKTSVSILEIQKQVLRGEECYYEDTFSHGNIFKNTGWETFVDAKDVTSSDTRQTGQQGGRRVPNDARWFSDSCISSKKVYRPPPPPPDASSSTVLSQSSGAVSSNNSIPTPKARTDTPPPTPDVFDNNESGSIISQEALSSDEAQEKSEDKPDARTKKRKQPETQESSEHPAPKKSNFAKIESKEATTRNKDTKIDDTMELNEADPKINSESKDVQTKSQNKTVEVTSKNNASTHRKDDSGVKKKEDFPQKRRNTRRKAK
jgi:hypothetical protein